MPNFASGASRFLRGHDTGPEPVTVKSRLFDIDNGAGVTIDDVLIRPEVPIVILAARIVYTTETTGTVAGANARIGTTVGGAEIVAATPYENTKAVGTKTDMVIVAPNVPAGTPVIVRHTGIAVTAAGQAYVELEYRHAA